MPEQELPRIPEPEAMDLAEEAAAYAAADFAEVNVAFVGRLTALAGADTEIALDLGTGPGDIPLRVLAERPHWLIAATDISWPMLRIGAEAARVAERHPSFVMADAKKLPFRDGAFGVVFSNSILHHVSSADWLWREVRRVAKPGALIFFRDLARPSSEADAAKIVSTYAGSETSLLREEYYRSLLSAYTVEEVRGHLDSAGLDGLSVEMVTDRHLDVFGRVNPL
jgi:ubiquinone/menaquinone biosynthesis C-methylase UbiE